MPRSVLFLPDYTESNPYQRLLADALEAHDVSVDAATGGGLLPVLRAYVTGGRPAVVHLHWLHPYLVGRGPATTAVKGVRFVLQLLLLRALGVHVVWTIHNHLSHDTPAPRVEAAFKHAVLRVSSGIVHCGAARRTVVETFRLPRRYRSRLHVIPHGNYVDWYPNEQTRAESRRRLGLPDEPTVFLFFGRVTGYKNLPALVEAFRALDRSDVRLLVAGPVEREALAETLREAAGLDDRIRLELGYVADQDVQVFLTAADAVVLPYVDVLTSGSAVLAASFARAIVAPARGCIPERFGRDAGLLYDPTAEGIEEGLHRALAADLDRIGRAQLERVSEPSWGAIARSTVSVYNREPSRRTGG